jgi:hypothetical protein
MRAGQRRACGGPDVEDDATGHTSQHGACQFANSECEYSVTAQHRSAEHDPLHRDSLHHYALCGSHAESHSRERARRRAGEPCRAEQHSGQDEAAAADHDSDHDPVCARAGESYGAERRNGQGRVSAGGAEREYGERDVSARDGYRQRRQDRHPVAGGDRAGD